MDSTVWTPKHKDSKHVFKKKKKIFLVVSRKGWQNRGGSQENGREARQPTFTSMGATFTKVQSGKGAVSIPSKGEERTSMCHAGICTAWTSQTAWRFPLIDRKRELPKDNVAKVTRAEPSHRHQGMAESHLGDAGFPQSLHRVPWLHAPSNARNACLHACHLHRDANRTWAKTPHCLD